MQNFPDDIVIYIFSYLPVEQKLTLLQQSRSLYSSHAICHICEQFTCRRNISVQQKLQEKCQYILCQNIKCKELHHKSVMIVKGFVIIRMHNLPDAVINTATLIITVQTRFARNAMNQDFDAASAPMQIKMTIIITQVNHQMPTVKLLMAILL